MTTVTLLGKVIIRCDIHVVTGLRIGGMTGGLKIGGVDSPVIRDPYDKPYIPGSSLKGKLRSLIEKKQGVALNDKGMHICEEESDYEKCEVCKVWGTLPGKDFKGMVLTRLIVRDTFLDETSITEEMKKNIELPWTETKMETAINRLTGTAGGTGSLRTVERVPAGAVFKHCELIFSVLEGTDTNLLKQVFVAMELLENDYLGGMGSRGYGKVEFRNISVYWNSKAHYEKGTVALEESKRINNTWTTPGDIVKHFEKLKRSLSDSQGAA